MKTHQRAATGPPLPKSGEGAVLAILAPGLQTTVQDGGRPGLGRLGIPPGGAADQGAFRRANRLVGNDEDAAILEIALAGPHLHFAGFAGQRLVAVTGADLGPALNGRPLPVETAVPVREGDELRFGGRVTGARAYLAVQGGFDLPVVLGSRSTDLTAGFGGLEGRALRTGDVLRIGDVRPGAAPTSSGWSTPLRRDRPLVVRFVAGPQVERFALPAFCRAAWRVSASSNRVGLRLDGPRIAAQGGTDIISEGMTTGAIQITNEGQPIVMLLARATIGGYARIGTVIGADLDRLAQLAPGDPLRFRAVSVAEARTLTLAATGERLNAASEEWDGLRTAIGLVQQMAASPPTLDELTVDLPRFRFHLRVARPR